MSAYPSTRNRRGLVFSGTCKGKVVYKATRGFTPGAGRRRAGGSGQDGGPTPERKDPARSGRGPETRVGAAQRLKNTAVRPSLRNAYPALFTPTAKML